MDTGKPTSKMAGYKVPETFGDVMISQMLHAKNIFTTWKESMPQLPFILVYHSPKNSSPLWISFHRPALEMRYFGWNPLDCVVGGLFGLKLVENYYLMLGKFRMFFKDCFWDF